MSVYSSTTRRSVGESLATSRFLAPGAPAYTDVTQQLVEQVKKLARRETVRRNSALPVLFPFALDPLVATEFAGYYPEYRFISLNSLDVVHPLWQAHRFMAVHTCLDEVMQYTNNIIAVGDALYQCGTRGLRSIHLEGDSSDSFAQHSRHTSTAEYVRVARNRLQIEEKYGYEMPQYMYRDFVMRKVLQLCESGSSCTVKAEGMVVDLTMSPMSVTQVCSAMVQAGAKFASVFFPYTPDVFRMRQGPFDGASDVLFRSEGKNLDIIYPDGVAGVTRYPLGMWAEWLKSTTAKIVIDGVERCFRIELTQTRGPFMYANIVYVDSVQSHGVTKHALEMPWGDDRYLLSYSQLKNLGSDPVRKDSWEERTVLVSRHVADKLYLYALSMDQADFRPELLLQRISKIDSRVVTSGTLVTVRQPMDPDTAAGLTFYIYAKAFLARYEMGRLGDEIMKEMKYLVRFADASRPMKLAMIVASAACWVYNVTLGTFFDWLKSFLVEKFLSPSLVKLSPFAKAPTFVLLSDYNGWFFRRNRTSFETASGGAVAVVALRGAKSCAFIHESNRLTPTELPLGEQPQVESTGELVDDVVDTSVQREPSDDVRRMVHQLSLVNDVTRNAEGRMELRMQVMNPEVDQTITGPESYNRVVDPAVIMTEVSERVFPGLAHQDYELDASSMRYDSQSREVVAEYMEHPIDDPVKPTRQEVYKSRVKGYHVERKAQSLQETLTSMQARTLSAPALRVETDETAVVLETWEALCETLFADDYQSKLDDFARDKVGFEKELLEEWGMQAKPENVRKVLQKAMLGVSFEDIKLNEYEIMMKSDAKPPMSAKPLKEVIAPQLIVMQDKYVSALYSSIFRLMSRRFISLLKPSIMVNLLKDVDGIRDHIAANHPWLSEVKLKFLENDFSKFDKSQDSLMFALMTFIMKKLGFDDELADRWADGNARCSLKSMCLGIFVITRDQNKSGGPATAFQNLIGNTSSTAVAYRGTEIVWGVYMGDDSLMACKVVVASAQSLARMAETFNFEAKFFVLENPYMTSCFVLFNYAERKVVMAPDPIKRIQKLSVSVNAVNPQWEDKARSAYDTLKPYRYKHAISGLAEGVMERYGLIEGADLELLFDALATVSSSEADFRSVYEENKTVIVL